MNGPFTIGVLMGAVIGLVIAFAPSILAVLRGNFNKGQVIKYQLLVVAVNIVISIVIQVVIRLFPLFWLARICNIVSTLWSLVALGLWIYILVNAIRDTSLTLLSRFGINI